jgi:hypothetical protein
MKLTHSQKEHLSAALAVAVLLILTATGNALVMLVGAVLALLVGLALRLETPRRMLLAGLVAAAVAAAIVLGMRLG